MDRGEFLALKRHGDLHPHDVLQLFVLQVGKPDALRPERKNPCGGKPGSYRMILGRIGEWAVFLIGLVLVLLPSQLG